MADYIDSDGIEVYMNNSQQHPISIVDNRLQIGATDQNEEQWFTCNSSFIFERLVFKITQGSHQATIKYDQVGGRAYAQSVINDFITLCKGEAPPPPIDFEYEALTICQNGTWHQKVISWIDGVPQPDIITDLGISCDEPPPKDPEFIEREACVNGVIQVTLVKLDTDENGIVTETVIGDPFISGIKCNENLSGTAAVSSDCDTLEIVEYSETVRAVLPQIVNVKEVCKPIQYEFEACFADGENGRVKLKGIKIISGGVTSYNLDVQLSSSTNYALGDTVTDISTLTRVECLCDC